MLHEMSKLIGNQELFKLGVFKHDLIHMVQKYEAVQKQIQSEELML